MLKEKQGLLILFLLFFFLISSFAYAFQLNLIYSQEGDITIENFERFQSYYDELRGVSRNYYISSDKDFELIFSLGVPIPENTKARYSVKIFLNEEEKGYFNGLVVQWQPVFDDLLREYFLKSEDFKIQLPAGNYRLEVSSADSTENQGKYILIIGSKKFFEFKPLLNIIWQAPLLKSQFFNSPLINLLFSLWGIAVVGFIGFFLILISFIYYLIGWRKKKIEEKKHRTLLLASDATQMIEEIKSLLRKPVYNTTVAFLYVPTLKGGPEPWEKDLRVLKEEMAFNVEEIIIEGLSEKKLESLIEYRDIIFVANSDIFLLLEAMKKCNFKELIEKMLKKGKVYIGSGAGSIVAGKKIRTAFFHLLKEEKEKILEGLKLVPFEIFINCKPEDLSLLQKEFRWRWQKKRVKILTDQQALLVQGKEAIIIGRGDLITL